MWLRWECAFIQGSCFLQNIVIRFCCRTRFVEPQHSDRLSGDPRDLQDHRAVKYEAFAQGWLQGIAPGGGRWMFRSCPMALCLSPMIMRIRFIRFITRSSLFIDTVFYIFIIFYSARHPCRCHHVRDRYGLFLKVRNEVCLGGLSLVLLSTPSRRESVHRLEGPDLFSVEPLDPLAASLVVCFMCWGISS
jgi:hypothetical protein